MASVPLAGGAGEAASGAVKYIADLLLNPSLNEALSPAAGLSVTPFYFQSVEQEGRWKQSSWGYNYARDLIGPQTGVPADDPNPPTASYANPWDAIWKNLPKWREFDRSSLSDPSARRDISSNNSQRVIVQRVPLLTISIADPPLEEKIILDAASVLAGAVLPVPVKVAVDRLLQPATLTIDATWLSDDVEIFSGVAALAHASGFASTFGHKAKVEISGIPCGNYLPAAYLIGLSGYVNPVGPKFYEYRCGVILGSGAAEQGGAIYAYGSMWGRDTDSKGNPTLTDKPDFLDWRSTTGWIIDVKQLFLDKL